MKVREINTGKQRNLPVFTVKDGSKQICSKVAYLPQTCSEIDDLPTPPTTQPPQTLGTTPNSATPNFGYEGSIGFGLGCIGFDLPSFSTYTSGYGAASPPQNDVYEEQRGKSKAETLEPETLEPKPTPKAAKGKVKCASDGTHYPEDFNSWLNKERLEWLRDHGYKASGSKQIRMVDTASQKTEKPVQKDGKPETFLAPAPHSAAPPPTWYSHPWLFTKEIRDAELKNRRPEDFCSNGHYTGGFDDECDSTCRPISIEPTEAKSEDNWESL